MEFAALPTASRGVRALDQGRVTIAVCGESLYAAGIATETRFVSVLALTDEGTPVLATGGLVANELPDGDAPYASAVAASASILAAAVNGKTVSLFNLADLSLQRDIAHTTLPVRALAISDDEKLVAVAGDECSVRVIDLATPTAAFDTRIRRSAKAVAFDPSGRFLAVTAIDGSAAIIDVVAHSIARSFDHVKIPDNDDPVSSSVEFPLAWHPSGAALAFGTNQGVHVIARETWTQVYALQSPSAPTARTSDKYAGCVALAWSPNGRYLAGIDSRRIVTIWDMATPALDPVTRAPVVPWSSAVPGAGEPAVALHGFIGSFAPDADDDAPEAPSMAVHDSSPRPTALHWHAGGAALVVADSHGCLRSGRLSALLRSGGEPLRPLTAPVQWPLVCRTAAEAASPADPKAPAAAGGTAQAARGRLAKTGGRRVGGGYGDAEAAESSGDDGEGEAGGEPGTPAGGDGAAAAAAAGAQPGARGGAAEVVSVAATKRRFGFADVDGGDGDEGGGLRSLDDYDGDPEGGRSGGGGTGAPASLEALRELGVVTQDALLRHTEQTGVYVREVHGLAPPQAPFQSGSTRFEGGGGSGRAPRRYMVWNTFATVTCRREPLGNAIVVDFADTARHRPLNMTDQMHFSIADVKEAGLILCSRYVPPQSGLAAGDAADEGAPSYIYFKSFLAWGGGPAATEWRLELPVYKPHVPASRFPSRTEARSGSGAGSSSSDPEDLDLDTSDAAESALAAAVGDGWVAVATDRQLVRFFRTSGLQDDVVPLPGAVVTLAGHGALCAVAYHRGMPSANTQQLEVRLFLHKGGAQDSSRGDAGAFASTLQPRRLGTVQVPMRPHAQLQWLGFSAGGQLFAHDSLGSLFALKPDLEWALVADTRLLAQTGGRALGAAPRHDSRDSYWPVGVLMVPAASLNAQATAGGPDAAATAAATAAEGAVGKPSTLVPALMAVLCKGAIEAPAMTLPRPLTVPLALRGALLAAGPGSALDANVQVMELMRVHRQWLRSLGLHPASGCSIALSAALTAAAATSRGDSADPVADIAAVHAKDAAADATDCADIDVAVIRALDAALADDRDLRAVQLASRLHLDRMYNAAVTVANKRRRAATAERIAQLLIVRDAAGGVAAAAPSTAPAPGRPAAAPAAAAPQPAAAASASRAGYGLAKAALPPAPAAAAAPRGAPPARASAAPPSSSSAAAAAAATASALDLVSSGGGSTAPRTMARGGAVSDDDEDGGAGGDAPPVNPFAKSVFQSPKRKRGAFDGLVSGSPAAASMLNRQSSVATGARDKRLRELQA